MTIIGTFILPHGSLIFDGKKDSEPEDVKRLYKEMKRVSKDIESLGPDLVFITTPHSISTEKNFGIYLNVSASGSAEWEGNYQEYEINVKLNTKHSNQLLKFLEEKENKIDSITCYTQSVAAPLRWGEVVPLWFLREQNYSHMIMSQPARRYTDAKNMISECMILGENIHEYFNSITEKVVIIISADLSHTHQESSVYGFKEEAEEFDSLIEKWVRNGDRNVLEECTKIVDDAMVCGFVGLSILQGIHNKENFTLKNVFRAHPTYYGMLIAEFI